MIVQSFRMVFKKTLHCLDFAGGSLILKAQEDYSFVWASLAVNLLSKVLVVRYQDPIVCKCLFNDLIVVHSARFLVYREDVMALFS